MVADNNREKRQKIAYSNVMKSIFVHSHGGLCKRGTRKITIPPNCMVIMLCNYGDFEDNDDITNALWGVAMNSKTHTDISDLEFDQEQQSVITKIAVLLSRVQSIVHLQHENAVGSNDLCAFGEGAEIEDMHLYFDHEQTTHEHDRFKLGVFELPLQHKEESMSSHNTSITPILLSNMLDNYVRIGQTYTGRQPVNVIFIFSCRAIRPNDCRNKEVPGMRLSMHEQTFTPTLTIACQIIKQYLRLNGSVSEFPADSFCTPTTHGGGQKNVYIVREERVTKRTYIMRNRIKWYLDEHRNQYSFFRHGASANQQTKYILLKPCVTRKAQSAASEPTNSYYVHA